MKHRRAEKRASGLSSNVMRLVGKLEAPPTLRTPKSSLCTTSVSQIYHKTKPQSPELVSPDH